MDKAHRMSIDALYAAEFMSYHSTLAVQTICMLIHVGHNLGQSDLISVLLACGMRIGQCLGLHQLGKSKPFPPEIQNDLNALVPLLIGREIGCRAWWFLIRQDWLQIPFLNTYTIHPTQFNTPMPKNCFDDFDSMVQAGEIVDQGIETYTDCSYTSVLNNGKCTAVFLQCPSRTKSAIDSVCPDLENTRPNVSCRASRRVSGRPTTAI